MAAPKPPKTPVAFSFELSPQYTPELSSDSVDEIDVEFLADAIRKNLAVILAQSSLSRDLKLLAIHKAVNVLFDLPEENGLNGRTRSATHPLTTHPLAFQTSLDSPSSRRSHPQQSPRPRPKIVTLSQCHTPISRGQRTPSVGRIPSKSSMKHTKTPKTPKTPKTSRPKTPRPKTPHTPLAQTSPRRAARQRSYSVGSYLSRSETNTSNDSLSSNRTVLSQVSTGDSYTSCMAETDYHRASNIFGASIKSLKRPIGTVDRENPRLDDLLYRPPLDEFFEDFLTRKLAQENIDFIKAVDEYRVKPPNIKMAKAVEIYNKYFGDDAACQVNIEHKVATDLARRIEKVNTANKKTKLQKILPNEFFKYLSAIFDEADESVRTLLEACQVPEFLHTEDWIIALNQYDQQRSNSCS